MKNKYKIVFLLAVFTLMTSFAMHKFYVSVTQIDFVPKKHRVEITSRIFIDDFEKVLKKKNNKNIFLATKKQIPEADKYVAQYLEDKIRIIINNKQVKLDYLAMEIEDDVLICYLRVPFSEKITTFEIFNSVFTELFPEQKNIVHTDINGNKKSVLLTYSERSILLEF
jgi:ABC-type microcin C transport system permease subunit YejE